MTMKSDKSEKPVPASDVAVSRDEALLDSLQQARYILSHKDLLADPEARVERAKLAIEEALRLMKPLRF